MQLAGQDPITSELILNLKAGQKSSSGELFDLYGPKICCFALTYPIGKPDAELLNATDFNRNL